MFDHVEFRVAQITEARRFYGAICAAVGAREIFFDADVGEVGFGVGEVVTLLLTGGAATVPKMHICFRSPDKTSVERAYAAALAAGGRCNGPPGYRTDYGPGYFAAFMIDPDGHNIEALFREPV
ncbi:MAG: VOC family protein [Pseudomonadota bacterium]